MQFYHPSFTTPASETSIKPQAVFCHESGWKTFCTNCLCMIPVIPQHSFVISSNFICSDLSPRRLLEQSFASWHDSSTRLRRTTSHWTSCTTQRGTHQRLATLCIQNKRKAHTLGVGCINVSPTSTWYEPKDAGTEGSFEKTLSPETDTMTH